MSFSFKIAKPPGSGTSSAASSRPQSPLSRPADARAPHRPRAWHSHDSDSDDVDAKHRDELVTGFDAEKGLTRKHPGETKAAALVIPSLPNRDWRKEAGQGNKRRKKEMYLPDAVGTMRMSTNGDQPKTQGGLGTRDVINDSVVVGGIELSRKVVKVSGEDGASPAATVVVEQQDEVVEVVQSVAAVTETEEQRALRELMAGAPIAQERQLDAIAPAAADSRGPPLDEADAFRRDVLTRPDEPTLEDYAAVPVGQFGAALMRGMGWKAGTAASRTGRAGPVEAFVPTSRPALLGIGAKPIAEVLGEEKGKNGKLIRRDRREDMRFVPLLKRETDSGRSTPAIGNGTPRRSASPPRSGMSSRRVSVSPPRERDSRGSSSSKQPRSRDRSDREPDRRRDDRRDSERRDRDRDDRRDRDKGISRRERDDRDRRR